MINNLIIGTVQFGLDYGVTNQNGKINDNELNKIFQFCHDNNIILFDTAQDYGTSEDIISKYKKIYPNIKIITKSKFKSNPNSIIQNSLNKFSHINYFLLHSFNDYNPEIIKTLKSFKNISKIGVSIYNVDEAKVLLKNKDIQIIQLPLNYIDNQWNDPEFHKLLSERPDIEIHVRSIFLQGILLNPIIKYPNNIPKEDFNLLTQKIETICKKLNLSKIELCLAFINSCNWVHKFLIGIDNFNHLLSNFEIINKNIKLNQEQLKLIQNTIKDINPLITNPSKWTFN